MSLNSVTTGENDENRHFAPQTNSTTESKQLYCDRVDRVSTVVDDETLSDKNNSPPPPPLSPTKTTQLRLHQSVTNTEFGRSGAVHQYDQANNSAVRQATSMIDGGGRTLVNTSDDAAVLTTIIPGHLSPPNRHSSVPDNIATDNNADAGGDCVCVNGSSSSNSNSSQNSRRDCNDDDDVDGYGLRLSDEGQQQSGNRQSNSGNGDSGHISADDSCDADTDAVSNGDNRSNSIGGGDSATHQPIEPMDAAPTTDRSDSHSSSPVSLNSGHSKGFDVCTDTKPVESPKPFSSIPGPWPSLPLIGTGWQYFSLIGRYELSKLHEAHIDRYNRYGPIVKEEFQWGVPFVHVFDPADFKKVFDNQGPCPYRPPNEFASFLRLSKPDIYPNAGFANLNGNDWKLLKRNITPAISKLSIINESMEGQNEVCDDFIDYLWEIRNEDTNVVENIQEAAYRLALESICLLCLDSRIGSFPNSVHYSSENSSSTTSDGDILIEATKMLFDSFNKLYYGLPFWKYFTTPAYSNLESADSTIYKITSKYIDRAIELEEEHQPDSNHSVLRTLLANKDLSRGEVKVTVMDFIIGGIFSVSNSLVYLLYHLAANADVQEQLYQEIQSVLALSDETHFGDHRVRVSPNQLTAMTYLRACVTESFRLNSPVPGIVRVTTEPLVLSGYDIPVNTPVLCHCMAACRLEKHFENALEYSPKRWLKSDGSRLCEGQQNSPLMPFGSGTRMCVGKRFSENELYLTAARLVAAYRLELGPECGPLELKHAFMVIPANPISLRITRR